LEPVGGRKFDELYGFIDGNPAVLSWTITNWTSGVLADGIHTWRVRAVDKAGNTNVTGTWIFTVDITPPVLRIVSGPTNSKITNQAFSIRLTVNEDLGFGRQMEAYSNRSIPGQPKRCPSAAIQS